VDGTHLAQGRDKWPAVMTTVMENLGAVEGEYFFTS
jgi:hypothetical protein